MHTSTIPLPVLVKDRASITSRLRLHKRFSNAARLQKVAKFRTRLDLQLTMLPLDFPWGSILRNCKKVASDISCTFFLITI